MNGIGRSNRPLNAVKTVVADPIPSASVNTAAKVNAGVFASWRAAKRRCIAVLRGAFGLGMLATRYSMLATSPSLRPQRHHRIHFGGAAGGDQAGGDGDEGK